MQYKKEHVEFFAMTCTTKGHWPVNDKFKATTEIEQPKNEQEMVLLFRMCNFLPKYSSCIAELSYDL